jgi:hypothetical protein
MLRRKLIFIKKSSIFLVYHKVTSNLKVLVKIFLLHKILEL